MGAPLRLTNPHSVLAALETRPRDVLEIRLPPDGGGEAWQKVAGRAARLGIPLRVRPDEEARGSSRRGEAARPRGGRGEERRGVRPRRDAREQAVPPKEGRLGGALALVQERPGVEVRELFAASPGAGSRPGLWLALDCVQDPRNVGAIFRSAAFFGVAGVLLSSDRSAPLTAVSYDAASGGLEYVPFAWAGNLRRDLELARAAGLWILGADDEAPREASEIDRGRPWLLVLGNEEKGLRRLTREACDEVCRLAPLGPIRALNVSVAAAVLMAALRGPPSPSP